MSRPANTRSAETNKKILELMQTSLDKIKSIANRDEQLEFFESQKKETKLILESLSGSTSSEIHQIKKDIEREKNNILERERRIRGHQGVKNLAGEWLKEAQKNMIIHYSSLIANAEKERSAAEEKQKSLNSIITELRNPVSRTNATFTGTIKENIQREEIVSYVSQLKEQIAAPELIEPNGVIRDAIVAYLRTKGLTAAAHTFNKSGCIIDVAQRNDVVDNLNDLSKKVNKAKPTTFISSSMPDRLNDDEINLVSTVITKKSEAQRNQEVESETLIVTLVKSAKIDLTSAQNIENAGNSGKEIDRLVGNLTQQTPDLLDNLITISQNFVDKTEDCGIVTYELAQQVVNYKNVVDKAIEKNSEAEKKIEEIQSRKTSSLQTNPLLVSQLIIDQEENKIAKLSQESKGFEGQIEYLKTLKQASKVYLKKLESALKSDERRKKKADKKLKADEELLLFKKGKLESEEEEVRKLITEAENKVDRKEALEARSKAIILQRKLFGEKGVQELAYRWGDEAFKTLKFHKKIEQDLIDAQNNLKLFLDAHKAMTLANAKMAVYQEEIEKRAEDDLRAACNFMNLDNAQMAVDQEEIENLAGTNLTNSCDNNSMTFDEAREALKQEKTENDAEEDLKTSCASGGLHSDYNQNWQYAHYAVELDKKRKKYLSENNAEKVTKFTKLTEDYLRGKNIKVARKIVLIKKIKDYAKNAKINALKGKNIEVAREIVRIKNEKDAATNKKLVALNGKDISVAHEIVRIKNEKDAATNKKLVALDGKDISVAREIVEKETARAVFQNALDISKTKIEEKSFILGGYNSLKDLYSDSGLKKEAKIFYELWKSQNKDLKNKEQERENLKNRIDVLRKQLSEVENELKDAEKKGSDTTPITQSYNNISTLRGKAHSQLLELTTKIDDLNLSLTMSAMQFGGQNFFLEQANKEIKILDDELRCKEEDEENRYQRLLLKTDDAEKEKINQNLALYTISIDDLTAKTPKIERVDEKGKIFPNALSEDKDRIELFSKVAESLFDLNDDNDPSMDLVPELRKSSGIEIKAEPESAELYVAFEDEKQAAAFCSKMNSFKNSEEEGILYPKACFVTGFDQFGNPKLEEQKKNSLLQYITPKLRDKNSKFDGKYVVLIEADCVGNKTPFNFAHQILQSAEAEKVIKRAENTSQAQRIIERKDEPIKSAVALLTGLGGITPFVVGGVATVMNIFVTTPYRWSGLPGSSVVSTLNQGMYDFAAFGMKRGNLLSYFSPDNAKKISTELKDSSKTIQEKEEKNAAQGIKSLKGVNNVFNALIISPLTFIPSAILKTFGAVLNFCGDESLNLSTRLSDYAERKWSEGGINNSSLCATLLLASAGLAILGTVFRTTGMGFGAIGEVLSKPSKAFHPEGSVAETRTMLGGKLGYLIRKLDRGLENARIKSFTPKETFELKIELQQDPSKKLTAEEIKDVKVTTGDKKVFDEIIKNFALDIKLKFNEYSGIKDEKNQYAEIANVYYDNATYKVSLGANNAVVVARVGKVNDHKANNFPPSLAGKIPGFIAAVQESLSAKREAEEKSKPCPSIINSSAEVYSSSMTLRKFREEFGGISSSLTTKSVGDVLKDYLGKTYIPNTVRDVGKYSVKVDGDNNIHIGEIGGNLNVIEGGQEAKNLALFNVVSSLADQKGKKVDKQQISAAATTKKPNKAEVMKVKSNENKDDNNYISLDERRKARSSNML